MAITAENGKYEQNMKNRPKIRVFRFRELKLGINDAKCNYISDPAYEKLISPKTKKLAPILYQIPPPSLPGARFLH